MTYFAYDKNNEVTRVVAQSDESITSTLQQDDDELLFAAEPNSVYFIEVLLKLTCASATPDMRYDFENSITNATWLMGGDNRDKDAAGLSGNLTPNSSGHLGAVSRSLSGTSAEHWIRFEVIFETLTFGGIVHMRWGQNNSDATALVRKAGSYLIARKVE